MSAPATRERKKANKTAAAAARKPYSRPAPAKDSMPEFGRVITDQQRKEMHRLNGLRPEVLAVDMSGYAHMFKSLGQMLKTDSGKEDTQMHQVCRWYAQQIEALEKKVPVMADGQPLRVYDIDATTADGKSEQKFEHWREEALIVHLSDTDADADAEAGQDHGKARKKGEESKKAAKKPKRVRCSKCNTPFKHLRHSPNHGSICEDCFFATNQDEEDNCDCDGECGHPGCDCACHGEFEYQCAVCDDYAIFKGDKCENATAAESKGKAEADS
jgi:hypothetical protein